MIRDISLTVGDWDSLIGKTLRKSNMISLGVIIRVAPENDVWWNNDKIWIYTDKDQKILANKIGRILESSVILEVY
jgi:hypothetical protein